MVTFLGCILLLIVGYMTYGRIVEKVFAPDDRPTPAISMEDGVDYVPMKGWKIFLIQLLNIAGLGPITGAIMGAMFGPVVYLWIVFGTIFGGAVHDYMAGMLSMRNRGGSISELTGKYLGKGMLQVMRVFSVILLVMVGTVFSVGSAGLLAMLTPNHLNTNFWLVVTLIYFFIATFVPVDKVIGKIYPLFGICLIVMALGVGIMLPLSGNYNMPELWNNFGNQHPSGTPIWPYMFITVACGAISGFHATQSPMMARCCSSEKQGRRVFYGAMVAEGMIAMVWAAAGVSFYNGTGGLQQAIAAFGSSNNVVYDVCQTLLGPVGGVLAMIGVIACPITSGDTAFRSARLTLADWFKLEQSSYKSRFLLTVPLLLAGAIIGQFDYTVIWRYFSWSNQTLAMIALWAASFYLWKNRRNFWICAIPASFMSAVSITYFMVAGECMGLVWTPLQIPSSVYYPAAIVVGTLAAAGFLLLFLKKTVLSNSAPATE